jgi:hypothetical protein
MTKSILLAAALGFVCETARADPLLPHLLSDHLVFQRDRDIRVWGWADPGERIEASLGPAKREGKTGDDGRWELILPPMSAGGPFVLTVQGKKTIQVKDVMIGEVWVASGQSNMTFALHDATGAAEEILKADRPEIRLFTVPGRVALTPQQDTLPASWKVCTPDTAKEFSAVAYYFSRRLQESLRVPIGIILSAWPGSGGEEWSDAECIVLYSTGQPITIYADNPYDPAWAAVYPNFNLSGYSGNTFNKSNFNPNGGPGNQYFPTSIASDPALGQLSGPVRQNALRCPGVDNEDASLLKYFSMGADGRYKLSFRAEFYDVLNRHSYFLNGCSGTSTTPTSSNFGQITGVTGGPRTGQFAMRFTF